MPDKASPAVRQPEILHGGEKGLGFHLDRLGQEPAGARAQKIRQGIINLGRLTQPHDVGKGLHRRIAPSEGSGRLDTRLDTPPSNLRRHPFSRIAPQELLDAYYPAFCRFGRMLQGDKYIMRFTLRATECIVFDNHRIVHGRAACSATSGDRYLRGCYADRAEMRSTYRALVTEGRFKA